MANPSFGLCIPGLLSETGWFPISRRHQIVGRSPGAGIRIGDRSVSRKHAEVWAVGTKVLIRDMKSRNGTYLGRTRVSEVELQAGDEICVGRVFRLLVTNDVEDRHLQSAADTAAETIMQFLKRRPEAAVDRDQVTSMYSLARSLFDCTDTFQSLVATNEWMSDWLEAQLAIVASPGQRRTTFTDRLSGHGTAGTDYDADLIDACVDTDALIFRRNVARYDRSADATIRRDVVAIPVQCSGGCKGDSDSCGDEFGNQFHGCFVGVFSWD